MKHFLRLICLLVVFATLAAIPAYAQEVTPRGSNELNSYRAYCTKISSTQVVVSFQVIGTDALDEIGANTIKVQYSSDGVNWTTAKTFRKANYPSMVDHNTSMHATEFTAIVPSGKQYRAYVEFYGEKDGSLTARGYYTAVIT
jgi:hypothetical protein